MAVVAVFMSPNHLLQALAEYDFSGQDEQAIREQWIYPLLSLLGYGIGTPNHVDIPFKVDLRPPARALGHKRWEIDYRPTVHGVGLWIIEAKRPDEDLFSEQHLGQAWGYATHPRVDVPFMALANGTRVCVFDLAEDIWEKPFIDIEQADLPSRFAELEAVLGARRVAEEVRRRQLRHLRTALRAQLDDDALEQTLADVRAIVDEARPLVEANRAAVRADAWVQRERERDKAAREIDVWGNAFAANSPNMVVTGDLTNVARMVREREPGDRAAAFDEMLSVARVGDTVRQTFSLRVFRLGVALRLVGVDGCDDIARRTADEVARDAAERFPDSPVDAAAHDFERALSAFLARWTLASGTQSAREAAGRLESTMDVERFLREDVLHGLSAAAMLDRTVELRFRLIWTAQEPWKADALADLSETLRAAHAELGPPPDIRIGQIGNKNYEMHLLSDPLGPGVANVIADVVDRRYPLEVDDDLAVVQRRHAADVLHRRFPGHGRV